MSTIESLFIGNTAGLSRVDKALRYFFFALLIGTIVYSIGGTFFGRDNRLHDYGLADAALLLAVCIPGYSRHIPGAHRALRACEWAVMACSLVCTATVIVGDVTDHGVRPDPYNMPWNVAMGAALVAFCFYTILLVSKERARRRGLLPPAH
ncbi:hypothetical protein HMPREF1478_01430 [Actinomyces sp. HPA0247]|uniref:hypothetical protein n=1 Tax=Actinomyces sp. HPA0247 TaxID=1203556 RepID=UPI00034EB662|nr:hypothetical protein [Actinomyces sp. HPA0247]EPD72170.1 hypothetical protein HMPREF1478_01430 [Actinomyces sp. HPA0247]